MFMFLFSKEWRILFSISLLIAIHDDSDTSIQEGVKDSN